MKTFCRSTIFLSFFLLNINSLFAQNTFIPDDNFEQALIDLGYDSGMLNDSVPTLNIKPVTSLNVNGKNIGDLTGIKDFTALTTLNCSNNKLTVLNTSYNLSLLELLCFNNQISTIDLSTNTNLTRLVCYNNNLTEIDLSAAPALITLNCSNNQLSSLDLSKNISLKYVNCSNNQLHSLNLKNGNNNNMTGGNYWETNIDSRKNPDLFCILVDNKENSDTYNTWLKDTWSEYNEDCSSFEVVMVYVPDDNFEQALINLGYDSGPLNDSVPTIAVKNLKMLNVSYKNITDLTGIEDFVALEQLYCYNNQISVINLTTVVNLKVLQIQNNKLSDLDLSLNPFLNSFDASNNQLTRLNLQNGNNTNMSVNVQYNPDLLCIQVDDEVATYTYSNWYRDYLSGYSEDCSNYKMEMIYVPDDNFEQALINRSLDFGELNDSVPLHVLTYLKELDIRYCNISNLSGIEKCKSLISLKCWGNNIDSLDLSANSKLKELYCYNNNISKLVLGLNNNLTQITCSNNKITELDLTRTPSLITLNIEMNKIIELDLSQNIALTSLKANYNQLSGLNLKNGNNHNLSLEVTYNPNLFCIEVDDPQSAIQNSNWYKNGYAIYSEDCTSYKPEMTYVPDNNFEQELINQLLDFGPLNDSVPTAGISSISNLTIDSEEIFDLTGIEHFSSLEFLNCNSNPISSIDVSSNIKLKYLECQNCQIKSLNVDKNLLLETLICSQNKIASLDLTSNSLLRFLWCNNNYLQNLDLSSNMLLTGIHCHLNVLTNINLQNGNNHKITYFKADGNLPVCILVDDIDEANSYPDWQIDSWSNYSLDCSSHHLDMVYIPDDNFEKYLIEEKADFGEPNDSVPLAKILNISNVNVNNRNITDLTGIEEFINIDALSCSNNQIKNLDLSSNPLLRNFSCDNNQLESLIINNNPELTFFYCNNNQLTNLDISSNKKLYNLNCSNNKLSKIDVSGKSNLTFFYCSNNNLLNLILNDYNGIIVDATNNPNLFCIEYKNPTQAGNNSKWKKDNQASYSENCTYDLRKTYIPDDNFEQALIDLGYDSGELDDSVLTANIKSVINLNIANKNISDLTGIEYFESLTSLICSLNQLSKLNLNKNKELDYLECGSNNLDSLNVDSLNLTHLSCSYNNLSQLEIKNSTDLIYLYCPFNSLKTIDLSNNKLLKELTISSNKLIELDLSLHTDLSKVFLFENELTMLNLQNGSNQSISFLDVSNNPNLSCIQIDNVQEANSFVDWYKDSWANYSEDCSTQDIRKTYIPDDNFEQALIDLGYDSGELDDSISTAIITNITYLNVQGKDIMSLQGIEDMENLTYLNCTDNLLTTLDLSNNSKLNSLYCVSNHLYSLNLQNGNNRRMTGDYGHEINIGFNPDLTCIQVDDAFEAETYSRWFRSSQMYFSENCESVNDRIPVSEYEALNALYNSLDGENWSYNYNWLDTINHVVDDWYGITVENGHVTQIYLDHTNTLGFIPKELGNLTELRKLHLRYCGLSGGIPVELSNLKKLEYLNLSDGQLGPQFIDGVPNQVRCIPDELENLDSLTYFNIDFNKFMFNDIEAVYSWKNFNNFQFIYRAQYTSTMDYNEVWVERGKDIVISLYDYIAGPSDQYQWVKDNVWISGANSRTLELKNVQLSDEGSYYCRITNSVAQEATISSSNTDLKVKGLLVAGVPQLEYNSLVDLYFSTQGENWTTNTNWLDATRSVDTWFGITVEDGHVTQIQLNNNNLQNSAFEKMIYLPKLKWLDLGNNKLTGFNFHGTDSLVSLDSFMIYNNQLIFEDLIPAFSTLNYPNFSKQFNYSPQAKIGTTENIIKMTDENFSVEIAEQFLSPNDQFQWYKEYSPLEGETNSGIDFFPVSTSDTGSYYLQITNPYVPNLTLYSELIHIEVTNSLVDSLLLFDLTEKYPQLKTIWDNNDPFSTWPGVTFENGKVSTLNLSGLQLEGDFSSFFTDFDSLKWLDMSNNKLSGEFPKIGVINNSTIKSNGINNQHLKFLDISNNNFVFAELEPAFDFFQTIDTFIYAPQSMVGLPFDTTIYKNQPLTFKIANYTPGSFDSYSWSKDGTEITDANEFTFAIKNAAPGDSGYYTCAITNLLFPELTILSDTSRLNVLIPVGIDDFNKTHFNIYPNPAEKQIFVEIGNKTVNLKIFDIVGKLFLEKESFISGWINIEPFTSGIYFVRITSQNSETITKKVIFK